MEAVDKPRNITLKGALDLVTDTDKASEDACLAVIQSSCPDHAILGEISIHCCSLCQRCYAHCSSKTGHVVLYIAFNFSKYRSVKVPELLSLASDLFSRW